MLQNSAVIGFDARPLYRNRDGIGTFTEQTILAAAKKYPNTHFVGIIFRGDDRNTCLITVYPKNVSITVLPFSWRTYRAIAETGVWPAVNRYIKFQLTVFVYFNFVALPWVSKNIPKKLMVHDATFLKYPETVSTKNLSYLQKFVKKSVLKRNVVSYTLSNNSAVILREYIEENFLVASPGPTPLNLGKQRRKPDGSFLFIGTLEPRKNLRNLVIAYSKLSLESQLKHKLIIAGRAGWGNNDLTKIIEANKNIVRVNSPSDTELADLYRRASFFLMPSLFEGFGIPVLDAARFGIPVLTSANSPMQEILGSDGAIYVDPTSVESISHGMKTLVNLDDILLEKMVVTGQLHSKRFTWNAAADALFGEYVS